MLHGATWGLAGGHGTMLMMVSDKFGNGSAASGRIGFNLIFREAPNCPIIQLGGFIQSLVSLLRISIESMPVIAVSLNNEIHCFKHKVRLKSAKHCFMHLKLKAVLLKLLVKGLFNRGHLGGKYLAETGLSYFLFGLRSKYSTESGLPYMLSMFWRQFLTMGLTHPLSTFRTTHLAELGWWLVPIQNKGLAYFLSCFRTGYLATHSVCKFCPSFWSSDKNPSRHLFNYNINSDMRPI